MGNKTFTIGSRVDFEGSTYSVYGWIESIDEQNDEATVGFYEIIHPLVCEKCGSAAGLSKDLSTGEIKCLMTGCGHGHGFKDWKEKIKLSKLILAPVTST